MFSEDRLNDEGLVANLVYNFVLPEVEKEIVKQNMNDKEKSYYVAAHAAVCDEILNLTESQLLGDEDEDEVDDEDGDKHDEHVKDDKNDKNDKHAKRDKHYKPSKESARSVNLSISFENLGFIGVYNVCFHAGEREELVPVHNRTHSGVHRYHRW